MSKENAREKNGEAREAAQTALRSTGYSAVADLHCEAIDGLILLAGELPTFYLKQIAQEAVLQSGAATQVRNLVMVTYEDTSSYDDA